MAETVKVMVRVRPMNQKEKDQSIILNKPLECKLIVETD